MVQRKSGTTSTLVHLANLRFFGNVFRSTGVGMAVADLDGIITHANPRLEQMLGWNPGELIGQPISAIIPPGRSPISPEEIRAIGGIWSGDSQHRRKTGSVISTHLTLSLVQDDAENQIATVALIDDDSANRRQRARLEVLAGLGAALNADNDLASLLTRICREACTLFSVDGAYLSRLDEQAQELVGLTGEGPLADQIAGRRVPIADGNSLATALRERRAVIVHDVEPSGPYAEHIARLGVRSSLLVPLVRADRVLGLLALNDTAAPNRFGREDAELAGAFAEIAATALEDARLHAAERKKSERLLALTQVCQLLTASLESCDVLRAVAEGAQRLLQVDAVRIWLLETPRGPFRLMYSQPARREPTPSLDIRQSRMGKVITSGEPWQISDVRRDVEGFFWQQALDDGMRGCLIVPLIAQGQSSGGISFLAKQERVFEQEDVELALAFGCQAAVALRNAQTLERERRAGRLARLLDESEGLPPGDRAHVEQVLAALERFVEMASQPAPGYARARLDGRWLQDSPIITLEPKPDAPAAREGA